MTQHLTRRLILVGAGASLAAAACGDSDTNAQGGGGASTGGSNAGGDPSSGGGGASAGGANAGGAAVGGAGGGAGVCAMSLLVRGSNYATDPHDITVPLADLVEGTQKTYTSTTANNHNHMITLTEADFTALRNGETVKKYACFNQGTDHEWVFSCADPKLMPTFEGEFGTPGNCPA